MVLMPLPGTRVIPAGWSEHHRPTATATMTSECIVTRRDPAAGTTDEGGKFTPAAPSTIYTGPCRVQALRDNERLLARGETQETHRRYQVSLRHDAAEIKLGDIVAIITSVDSGLTGRRLRVTDVKYGSEQWERDISCDELEA